MKKSTTLFSIIFLLLFFSSCQNEKSLQSYLIDASGKDSFFTGDLPVSSLLSAKADVSDDEREIIQSIKKINFAFLEKTSENEVAFETEKVTIENIFKDNDDFMSLMSMKFKGMNVKVYYTGNNDAINEVIAFGYSKEVGLGVARLLGKNMNPVKIMEVLNSMKMNSDSDSLENLAKVFGK